MRLPWVQVPLNVFMKEIKYFFRRVGARKNTSAIIPLLLSMGISLLRVPS